MNNLLLFIKDRRISVASQQTVWFLCSRLHSSASCYFWNCYVSILFPSWLKYVNVTNALQISWCRKHGCGTPGLFEPFRSSVTLFFRFRGSKLRRDHTQSTVIKKIAVASNNAPITVHSVLTKCFVGGSVPAILASKSLSPQMKSTCNITRPIHHYPSLLLFISNKHHSYPRGDKARFDAIQPESDTVLRDFWLAVMFSHAKSMMWKALRLRHSWLWWGGPHEGALWLLRGEEFLIQDYSPGPAASWIKR